MQLVKLGNSMQLFLCFKLHCPYFLLPIKTDEENMRENLDKEEEKKDIFARIFQPTNPYLPGIINFD